MESSCPAKNRKQLSDRRAQLTTRKLRELTDADSDSAAAAADSDSAAAAADAAEDCDDGGDSDGGDDEDDDEATEYSDMNNSVQLSNEESVMLHDALTNHKSKR